MIDDEEGAVFEEVGDAAAEILAIGLEAPADVGVKHAAKSGEERAAVEVRGMGIAVTVGDLVMAAMGCAPADGHALSGGGAEDCEQEADGSGGFEGAMGEEAMEADGYAEAGDGVGGEHDDDFGPADGEAAGVSSPEEDDGDDESGEGSDDGEEHDELLEAGHAVFSRMSDFRGYR